MKHFEIENYRFIPGNNILVYIKRNKLAMPITIPKEQFYLFLLTENKLILPLVYSDETGTLNSSCKLTIDEYYEMDDETVHQDLYEYISTHPIIFRGNVYDKSLVSINYGFEAYKARRN